MEDEHREPNMAHVVSFSSQFRRYDSSAPTMKAHISPWLPSDAVIATASSFDMLMNLLDRFNAIRDRNRRGTLVSEVTMTRTDPRRIVDDEYTFVTCLIHIMTPHSQLMSNNHFQSIRFRFIQNTKAFLSAYSQSVASDYKKMMGKSANISVDMIQDAILRDLNGVLTDSRLNTSVVSHIIQRFDVAVTLRPGPPGSRCTTFIPQKFKDFQGNLNTLPCVLIGQTSDSDSSIKPRYEVEHQGPSIRDVWTHLRALPGVQALFATYGPRLDKLTITELHTLAGIIGMVFVHTDQPKDTAKMFGGKVGLVQALQAVNRTARCEQSSKLEGLVQNVDRVA